MIDDARLQKALTFLAETDERCAELKSDVERTEHKAKVLKHTAFLHIEGTVAEREAKAMTTDSVQNAYSEHFEAIKRYNAIANKRTTEELIVDVYRTLAANRRAGNVV